MLFFFFGVVPSVISTGTNDEAISICEAYISQVGRMAQKAFVFGLKEITFTSSRWHFFQTADNRLICHVELLRGVVM